jgi:ArsR family transcriptional regulator, cadmium/lead-responsive transcriptional repressor
MISSRLQVRATLLRGLGDPSRLWVLEALRDGPLTAGEVVRWTGLRQPNASMHLRCLAECGLVTWERAGRLVHYRIADKQVVRLLDRTEELALRVGPLIEACPRYRQPWRQSVTRARRGGCR